MPEKINDLKPLFDVGVSKKAELHFKKPGFDDLAVRDLNLSIKDSEILELAIKRQDWLLQWIKTLASLYSIRRKIMLAYFH
jgi:hypothetical protein